jgi:hypothetical protein
VVPPLLRYVIPIVLAFVSVSRLAASTGFEGWHELPDLDPLDVLSRDLGALAGLVILLGATLAVVRVLGRGRRPRPPRGPID